MTVTVFKPLDHLKIDGLTDTQRDNLQKENTAIALNCVDTVWEFFQEFNKMNSIFSAVLSALVSNKYVWGFFCAKIDLRFICFQSILLGMPFSTHSVLINNEYTFKN